MDSDTLTFEDAERWLTGLEALHSFAAEGHRDRWFFLEEARIILETSDLWTICWFRCGEGGHTAQSVQATFPFALRHWAEQPKSYLTAQDDKREDATFRYFVDYAAATREIADDVNVFALGQAFADRQEPDCTEAGLGSAGA
jgi:hypothetical protein